ncbi:hypothetical protein P7E30_00820 [Enterococcus gallinarum]|uniref:Uncharacterized protein n=1 Tax=Enterococcus gallinarum TaxID=1353 RepID=A0AAE4KW43_ENTGA|nr:hypothetical protein [Enterococcus gallinarum]MDT2688747.1 hypothetical protein [Enterococcus gallinarum]HJE79989.1 hypothetical protein [Enterococcus gallinarum]
MCKKINKDWPGITFPGGQVEKGKSFVDSVNEAVQVYDSINELYGDKGMFVRKESLFRKSLNNDNKKFLEENFDDKIYMNQEINKFQSLVTNFYTEALKNTYNQIRLLFQNFKLRFEADLLSKTLSINEVAIVEKYNDGGYIKKESNFIDRGIFEIFLDFS